MRTCASTLMIVLLAGCSTRTATISPALAVAAEEAPAPQPNPTTEEASKSKPQAEGFHFPDDRGGRQLGQLPPPPAKGSPADAHLVPRRFAVSPVVEHPSASPPLSMADAVRLPERKSSMPVQLGSLQEGLPLLGYRGTPQPPASP